MKREEKLREILDKLLIRFLPAMPLLKYKKYVESIGVDRDKAITKIETLYNLPDEEAEKIVYDLLDETIYRKFQMYNKTMNDDDIMELAKQITKRIGTNKEIKP